MNQHTCHCGEPATYHGEEFGFCLLHVPSYIQFPMTPEAFRMLARRNAQWGKQSRGYCLRCMISDVGECERTDCQSIVRPFRHLHVAGVTIQLKRVGDGLDFFSSVDRRAFAKALQGITAGKP